jgi:hypothetical protein
MPATKRRLKVFLCHASADKPKVRELYRYLRRRGVTPWFDEMDLVGGQDWQVEIPKAISTADAIIICLTRNSVDREGYVQREIKFALDKALEMPEGRIFIIPVRFEECEVPVALSRYQWVDLFDEAGYARMMRSLRFRAAQLERATVQVLIKDKKEEQLELEREQQEKLEREAAEKAVRGEAERKKAEKAEQDRLDREADENARKEEAARKATEKAQREKVKREVAEKAKQEKAARRTAQIAELKENFGKSLNSLKLAIPKAKPFLGIVGILGVIFALLWVSSWAMPQVLALFPTSTASITHRPTNIAAPSSSPVTITKTPGASSIPTKTYTSTLTVQTPSTTRTARPTLTLLEGITATNLCSDFIYLFKTASADEAIGDAYIAPNETFNLTGAVSLDEFPRRFSWAYGFYLETTGPFHSSTYTETAWFFLLYNDKQCVKFTRGSETLVLSTTTHQFEIVVTATPTGQTH